MLCTKLDWRRKWLILQKQQGDGLYTQCYLMNKQNILISSHLSSNQVKKRQIHQRKVTLLLVMCRTGDITWCWVSFQPKCISQRRKYSSSWHCNKDSFKNQTCIEDCRRDMTDTGKGEWGGGWLTALLKREILAILKSLGTLPPTVREPGFTPMHWSTGLLKQDEVSRSPPQSSCKSRQKEWQ